MTKKVIARSKHDDSQIISPSFLPEKPGGSSRLILSLKKLNENKKHFKMETKSLILKLVTPKTYFTKIDLKDVYYIISIAAEHQKYLKFFPINDLH